MSDTKVTDDPTDLHDRLGTDEFCRRLKVLEPKRAPLLRRRDDLQARLMGTDRAFWVWIETNEAELPDGLRDLMAQARQIRQEIENVGRELDTLWQATMEGAG